MTVSTLKARTPRAMTFARSQAGFNLLELMIVVAIIGILTGLAYTSYTDSAVKSRRKAATACLNEMGQVMERFYTTNLTYTGATPPATMTCRVDLGNFYTFTATPAASGRAYSIAAAPQGQQATKDNARCGTLTIDQTGAKTVTGSAAITECFP
jgi:type IV pilus assembly protein PilE